MARKNGIPTVRLQVSLDQTTDRVLREMVPLGLHGKNKAEVASWILREWIWHNQDALATAGVVIGGRWRGDGAKPSNRRGQEQ